MAYPLDVSDQIAMNTVKIINNISSIKISIVFGDMKFCLQTVSMCHDKKRWQIKVHRLENESRDLLCFPKPLIFHVQAVVDENTIITNPR